MLCKEAVWIKNKQFLPWIWRMLPTWRKETTNQSNLVSWNDNIIYLKMYVWYSLEICLWDYVLLCTLTVSPNWIRLKCTNKRICYVHVCKCNLRLSMLSQVVGGGSGRFKSVHMFVCWLAHSVMEWLGMWLPFMILHPRSVSYLLCQGFEVHC